MAKIILSKGIEEIVESGKRFGIEWAKLRNMKEKSRRKWFDNMIIKLDSPSADSFHKIIRKMVRTFYDESKEKEFKWNISNEVLILLSDKSRAYWRHAFMTGVFFGYYGYFEKTGEEVKNEQ